MQLPPTSVSELLGLNRRHDNGEGGTISTMGLLELETSQIYDYVEREGEERVAILRVIKS